MFKLPAIISQSICESTYVYIYIYKDQHMWLLEVEWEKEEGKNIVAIKFIFMCKNKKL